MNYRLIPLYDSTEGGAHVHTYRHTHTRTHVHTRAHRHAHTHAHIHAHTQTHALKHAHMDTDNYSTLSESRKLLLFKPGGGGVYTKKGISIEIWPLLTKDEYFGGLRNILLSKNTPVYVIHLFFVVSSLGTILPSLPIHFFLLRKLII